MRMNKSRFSVFTTLIAAASVLCAADAGAYTQYTASKGTATNCAMCHGDFRANNYVSVVQGAWNSTLMSSSGHQAVIGDCGVCHASSNYPVFYYQRNSEYRKSTRVVPYKLHHNRLVSDNSLEYGGRFGWTWRFRGI